MSELNPRDKITGRFLPKLNPKTDRKVYIRDYMRRYRQSPVQRAKAIVRTRMWILKNRERRNGTAARILWNWKIKALTKLGGKCQTCGLTDTRLLQINHKNGGGNRERKEKHVYIFYREIALGIRSRDDLDILCANHNLLYEYESGRRKVYDSTEIPKAESTSGQNPQLQPLQDQDSARTREGR